jgi:protein SCO1/2
MGIAKLAPRTAPVISLVDESGAPVSLAKLHGKVVVLSFFDATCSDICPVLTAELAQADIDLGSAAGRVVFLSVNTDPLQTSVSPATAAVLQARRFTLKNWYLLGGSLGALDAVWRSYGITINVSRTTRIVAHNDALYFIDPEGRLRFKATPYADESSTGIFSLSGPSIARWAKGIAAYSNDLLVPPR